MKGLGHVGINEDTTKKTKRQQKYNGYEEGYRLCLIIRRR